LVLVRDLAAETGASAPIPRYGPVATLPFAPSGLDAEGRALFTTGSREELPTWERAQLLEQRTSASRAHPLSPAAGGGGSVRGSSSIEPRPLSHPVTLAQETLTSCGTSAFIEAGVNASQVQPPFTVTLTDLTPSTGQSVPNGVVDAAGIHGHRIEKIIRLKIGVRDGTGSAPNYPVLIHLALGGPYHRKLILAPHGYRIQCGEGTFLPHQRHA